MRKYLIKIMLGTLGFFLMTTFLKSRKIEASTIIVQVEAEILEDDIFYVYYLQSGQKKWSDEYSVYKRLKGSKKPQRLEFVLPAEKPIERIRIDVGANKKQQPMAIKSVVLKSEVDQFLFSNNLLEYFSPNIYMTYKDDRFSPKIVSQRYDPFFTSKPQVYDILEKLRNPDALFSKWVVYLISFIFSISFVIFLFFLKINCQLNQAYISLFLLLLFGPSLDTIFGIYNNGKNLEKRELAVMPEFNSLVEFPREYEKYYNDNFGFRNLMIKWSSKIKIDIFKASPKPEEVQFGKKKFLFFNSLKDEVFASYTRTDLLLDKDLEDFYQKLYNRKVDLEKRGIKYVSGFWPNKHTIYKENLPSSMATQIKNNQSQADQITNYFQKKNFSFFDVREDVFKDKKQKELYRELDTHWNSDGAYSGYKSFCLQTNSILGLTPFGLDEFKIDYVENKEGDLIKLLGVESIFGYEEMLPKYVVKDKSKSFKQISSAGYPKGTIITRNENCMNKSKVLIFRDSYTTELIQFISLHFTEVIYVNERYNYDLINKINPDIAISCRVERYMSLL